MRKGDLYNVVFIRYIYIVYVHIGQGGKKQASTKAIIINNNIAISDSFV